MRTPYTNSNKNVPIFTVSSTLKSFHRHFQFNLFAFTFIERTNSIFYRFTVNNLRRLLVICFDRKIDILHWHGEIIENVNRIPRSLYWNVCITYNHRSRNNAGNFLCCGCCCCCCSVCVCCVEPKTIQCTARTHIEYYWKKLVSYFCPMILSIENASNLLWIMEHSTERYPTKYLFRPSFMPQLRTREKKTIIFSFLFVRFTKNNNNNAGEYWKLLSVKIDVEHGEIFVCGREIIRFSWVTHTHTSNNYSTMNS